MDKQTATRDYMPYVKYLAGKFFRRHGAHISMHEIIGYGCIGLMQAAESYDESRGFRFITHAHQRIWGAMMDGIRVNTPLTRNHYTACVKGRAQACYINEFNETEIAGDDVDIEDEIQKKTLKLKLEKAMSSLDERQRAILDMHYKKDMGFEEIGRKINLSKSYTSRKCRLAENKLRRIMETL